MVPAQSLHPEGSLQAAGQWYGPDDGDRIEIERMISMTEVFGNQDRAVLFESAATDLINNEGYILQAGSPKKRKRRTDKEDLPNKTERQRKKCEHGRQKSKCKQCWGASICEHGRQK